MSELQPNNSSYNVQTGTPLYEYGQNQTNQLQPQQTVNVTSPYTSQIYQYPQTSVYNDPAKQAASGVNIYIYNPSAMGGQSTSAIPQVVTYPQPQPAVQLATSPSETSASQPIANTPISEDNKKSEVDPSTQKTKRIVELTDDYIKTLESYLRNSDKSIRESGIIELVKRYQEDITRYDDEALTALLNIALQDSNPDNRVLAMMAITSGCAHGNEETIELLNKLQSSDKLYGREAKVATDALLKASANKTTIVRDFSSNNQNSN